MVGPVLALLAVPAVLALARSTQQDTDSTQTKLAGRNAARLAPLDELRPDTVQEPALACREVRADDMDVVQPGDPWLGQGALLPMDAVAVHRFVQFSTASSPRFLMTPVTPISFASATTSGRAIATATV